MAEARGRVAEESVIDVYTGRGACLLALRWRGTAGEIDLVLQDGAEIVFCEVKAARTHERAIARLGPGQMRRIHAAGEEFIGTRPTGSLTEVRFDLACVDGDGRVRIVENAFSHF